MLPLKRFQTAMSSNNKQKKKVTPKTIVLYAECFFRNKKDHVDDRTTITAI